MKIVIIAASVLSVALGRPNYHGYHGAPAPIGADGRVIDTPEVAHAKAAHLAAFAQAASRVHYAGSNYANNGGAYNYIEPSAIYHGNHDYLNPYHYSTRIQHGGYGGYQGPLAPLNHEGRVTDTPEVAQARASHLAAYQLAASKIPLMAYNHVGESRVYQGVADYGSRGYHDSSAPLGHDGRVIDTPEVAHAKAAHLAAHAHAATHGHVPYGPYGDY